MKYNVNLEMEIQKYDHATNAKLEFLTDGNLKSIDFCEFDVQEDVK